MVLVLFSDASDKKFRHFDVSSPAKNRSIPIICGFLYITASILFLREEKAHSFHKPLIHSFPQRETHTRSTKGYGFILQHLPSKQIGQTHSNCIAFSSFCFTHINLSSIMDPIYENYQQCVRTLYYTVRLTG